MNRLLAQVEAAAAAPPTGQNRIEYDGKRVLFDTGNDAEFFAQNVKAAGMACCEHSRRKLFKASTAGIGHRAA